MSVGINTRKTNTAARIAQFVITLLFFVFLGKAELVSRYFYIGGNFATRKIIPALFPFLFLTDLLIRTGALDSIGKFFVNPTKKLKLNPNIIAPCILGVICGIPLGAKCTKEYFEKGLINKQEADILLAAANCASPAFVIAAVGQGMLKDIRIGVIIWGVSVLCSLFISIFLLPKSKSPDQVLARSDSCDFDLSSSFIISLKNSVISIINIAFLVTFFYTLSSLLSDTLILLGANETLCAVLSSVIEFSSGCIKGAELDITGSLVCAFSVGFGGFCAYFQVKSEAHKNADMKKYLLIKGVCGLISTIFVLFLL